MIEPVLPAQRSWPLHATATTRAIEAEAASALPPHTLMRRAGAAVAQLALAVAPHARRVWIAAGPGNNGGDGLDAAIHLHAAGREVHVTLIGDDTHRPDDARDALDRARAAGVAIGGVDHAAAVLPGPDDLAIDALFGIGLTRVPEGEAAALISRLATCGAPVLAVDVPSGLAADTGMPIGDVAVRAAHTLALLALAPGLFTAAGREHAGRVWFSDLGIEPTTRPPLARLAGRATTKVLAARSHAAHKGSYGDLAVIGGAAGMVGAALLAARAGTAAGAGRTFVQLLAPDAPQVDQRRPELMLRPRWLHDAGTTSTARSVVVAGCGGGDAIRALLPQLLGRAGRLVLDADALNAIAADGTLQRVLIARADRGAATILTPHPLEAARLLGSTTAAVQADRLAAAHELAARWRSVVVLKGSGSIVAAPDALPSICATGSAALASAGTGDVLAGWIGGAWTEAGAGAPPDSIALASVVLHGAAGETTDRGPIGAVALIEAMRSLR